MSDFCRYVDLKKEPVITLKGTVSQKSVPSGVIMEDLEVEPEVLNTPITSLIYAGNWKAMVDTAFDLPVDPTHGEIRPTKSGHLYQFVKDTWVMIGHVMTRPM